MDQEVKGNEPQLTFQYPPAPKVNLTKEDAKINGVFFTDKKLAKFVASFISTKSQSKKIKLFDPCCGSGNLLAAALEEISDGNLQLHDGQHEISMCGFDIQSGYVREAKENLAAIINQNSEARERLIIRSRFQEKDFLKVRIIGGADSVVLFNPPYGKFHPEEKLDWAGGAIQKAAYFLYHLINISREGTQIVAILPDVMRSGTRYEKFRSFIGENLQSPTVTVYGKFGKHADVDVYVLTGYVGRSGRLDRKLKDERRKLSDVYDVRVGSVVPHRTNEDGGKKFYIDVRSCPGGSVFTPSEIASYSSRADKPPFVLVRRTSSPSDKKRIVASMVEFGEECLIENHLFVITPKSGSLECCRELFNLLNNDSRLDEYINSINRCRHITKSQLESLSLEV